MELYGQLVAVTGVLLLMAILLWLVKRGGIARIGRIGPFDRPDRGIPLHSVQRLALTPQHSLHLVRVADRAMLLGVSPSGCTCLQSFSWSDICPDQGQSGKLP